MIRLGDSAQLICCFSVFRERQGANRRFVTCPAAYRLAALPLANSGLGKRIAGRLKLVLKDRCKFLANYRPVNSEFRPIATPLCSAFLPEMAYRVDGSTPS